MDSVSEIPVCIDDFEKHARSSLPKMAYDYYKNGADEEITLRRNVAAFNKLLIRPRLLRDVSQPDASVSLLNGLVDLKSPICVAATACQKMAHPDGELATAAAASRSGALMVVSTIATSSLEEVAAAAAARAPQSNSGRAGLWFQLYVYRDRGATRRLVSRVERAGYSALVVTVDTPVSGKRRDDLRNSFALPDHLRMENFVEHDTKNGVDLSNMGRTVAGASGFGAYVNSLFDPALSWSTIDWLRSITQLPIILKGILTAEDALEACQRGIPALIVSNHGARQLDSAPATIEVLPEIVRAVDGRCEVYFDGGIRTGNSAFKAIALGAKAVFVGRPILWGLAYEGEAGVERVLDILNDEFRTTMSLSGCKNLFEIQNTPNLIVHEQFYSSRL